MNLLDLPYEILEHIFIETSNYTNLSKTCKLFYNISRDNLILKKYYLNNDILLELKSIKDVWNDMFDNDSFIYI